jgi:hypothetical protein
MDKGELLLSMGEWFNRDGVAWTEWGFVTTANDNGTARRPDGGMFGYASNGRGDNEAGFIRDGYILGLSTPTVSEEDAEREILRRAVARVCGAGESRLGPGDRKIVFGLRAMDEWIKGMSDTKGFCALCYAKGGAAASWKSGPDVAIPTVEGSTFSAKWLRRLADKRPSPAADHLRAAASHYDRIVALFGPALQDNGPESYRSIIGDLDKQKAHAEKVLRPVKAELAAAGDDMEKALALVPTK